MDIGFDLTVVFATLIVGVLFLVFLFVFSEKRRFRMPKVSRVTIWNIIPYLLVGYLLYLAVFSPVLLSLALPSTIAGLFGIIIGFWLNESVRINRRKEQAKQLLKAIEEELEYNSKIASSIENDMEKENVTFQIFKTNIWESFGSRLELIGNLKLVIRLSVLYHRLLNIANAIRYNINEIKEKGAEEVLTYVLDEEPLEGIKQIRNEISSLTSAIKEELEASASSVKA
jgi:hypothetical protein